MIKVPEGRGRCEKLIFNKKNQWKSSLKIVIREQCKKFPEYFVNITNSVLPMTVESPSGDKISVDTLGKWMFGVPGYKGHLIFDNNVKDKIIIYYPERTTKEAIDLLNDIINEL